MMMMIIQLLTLLWKALQSSWKSQNTELLPTISVTIPNEKVGYIFATRHLQQFLEEYPPPSDKQAFLDVYHILSLLDKYLYDNPKHHTHCMSSNNEHVALLKYAICLNVDLTLSTLRFFSFLP